MSVLHHVGDWLRGVLLHIPMEWARGLFVLVPAMLLLWVVLLPRSETTPPGRQARFGENLKWWAALALGCQILLYLLF